MTCSEYLPQISRFLDGELPAREAADVDRHLAACGECRAVLQHWQMQGDRLRNHLRRHALGDAFARRVAAKATEGIAAPRSTPQVRSGRRPYHRWMQAAAALVIGFVIFSQFSSNKEGIGYARVGDPGESLEILPPRALAWVHTTAGEILHPGDWLRNRVPGAAEILWRDYCRLTLEQGALAQIPSASSQSPDQLVLLRGQLSAEILGQQNEFQVRTQAGSVNGSQGRFSLRAGDLVLPAWEFDADDSMSARGTVSPFAALNVLEGRMKIASPTAVQEVDAGETALAADAMMGVAASEGETVEPSLKAVPPRGTKGTLTSGLVRSAGGLVQEIQVAGISVRRLLEAVTGMAVHGGDETIVTGTLRFSPGLSALSVVEAVGENLGLPIGPRKTTAVRSVASLPQGKAPAAGVANGSFLLERSRDGRISFVFRNVPLGSAFRILRSAVAGLPILPPEAEWLPVSLEANGLEAEKASAWIAERLELDTYLKDCEVVTLEVGMPVSSSAAAPGMEQGPPGSTAAPPAETGNSSGNSGLPETRSTPQTGRRFPGSGSVEPGGRISELLPGSGMDSVASDPDPFIAGLLGAWGRQGTAPSSADGKASGATREFLGLEDIESSTGPSTYLIWPPLDELDVSGLGSGYRISNRVGLPARTLWRGYDQDGSLVAEFGVLVNGSSEIVLSYPEDLPAELGIGGHWETTSDVPLTGSRRAATGADPGFGLPRNREELRGERYLPASWITLFEGRFWLVNPAEEPAAALVALVQGDRILAAVRVAIPGHGALFWPDPPLGAPFDYAALDPGAAVMIRALQGTLASGLAR